MANASERYQAELARADARLARILERYAFLDDFREVVRRDPANLRKAIRAYVADLRPIIAAGVDAETLAKVVAADQKEIAEALRQYEGFENFAASAARAKVALKAAVLEQSANARTILSAMRDRLNAKTENLRIQAAAMGLARERASAELDRRLEYVNFTAGGKQMQVPAADLKTVWEGLETRYGTTATITYRDGKNYPLQTYVESKGLTLEREIQNTVASVEAAAAGLAVGQFEAYGSGDSCVLWEGRMVFFTETGKREFLRAHGKRYPKAYTWPTLAEVKADKTHMLGFNCRHDVLVVPLEMLEPDDFAAKEIGAAPKVPKTSRGVRLATEAAA